MRKLKAISVSNDIYQRARVEAIRNKKTIKDFISDILDDYLPPLEETKQNVLEIIEDPEENDEYYEEGDNEDYL